MFEELLKARANAFVPIPETAAHSNAKTHAVWTKVRGATEEEAVALATRPSLLKLLKVQLRAELERAGITESDEDKFHIFVTDEHLAVTSELEDGEEVTYYLVTVLCEYNKEAGE